MATDNKAGKVTDEHRTESKRLRAIWDSEKGRAARAAHDAVSQDAFGFKFGIGNQSAVGFFLNGKTALSLKAALGFARGLECVVGDFSPRLAALLADAPLSTTPSLRQRTSAQLSKDERRLLQLFRAVSTSAQAHFLKQLGQAAELQRHLDKEVAQSMLLGPAGAPCAKQTTAAGG